MAFPRPAASERPSRPLVPALSELRRREWPAGGGETARGFVDPQRLRSRCPDLLERII